MKGFALRLALKQRRKATRKSRVPWLTTHSQGPRILSVNRILLAVTRSTFSRMCYNCNARALFTVSTLATIISEVCFFPVLVLVRRHLVAEGKGGDFCWNWSLGPPDGTCPFVVLFLAALLTGILLVCTAVHIILAFWQPRCGQSRSFFKYLFRFGTFAVNLIVLLLALIFIALIIAFSFSTSDVRLKKTGNLLKGDTHSHSHFILVCLGTLACFAATVFSAMLAFKPRRPAALDELIGDSIFQSFVDHGTLSDYQEINWWEFVNRATVQAGNKELLVLFNEHTWWPGQAEISTCFKIYYAPVIWKPRKEVSLNFRWLEVVHSVLPLDNQTTKKWNWVFTPPPRVNMRWLSPLSPCHAQGRGRGFQMTGALRQAGLVENLTLLYCLTKL